MKIHYSVTALLCAVTLFVLMFTSCSKEVVCTVTIFGSVVDANTYAPVQNACVEIKKIGKLGSVVTGSDGSYELTFQAKLEDDEYRNGLLYRINVTKSGYKEGFEEVDVEFYKGQTVKYHVDFSLSPINNVFY